LEKAGIFGLFTVPASASRTWNGRNRRVITRIFPIMQITSIQFYYTPEQGPSVKKGPYNTYIIVIIHHGKNRSTPPCYRKITREING
jgi:hypothetical protein